MDHVTLLMVEDDPGHARLIEKNLRRAGIHNELVHVRDGTSALEYLFGGENGGASMRQKSLLILLDLNLPDMRGVDILQRIKADPHLRLAPVVVLTTTDDRVEMARCYDLGANVYVTKPVAFDEFAEAIQQLGLFLSIVQVPQTK
jgi:CheY-like chemotaxis protein